MTDHRNFDEIIQSNHSIRQCIQESVNDFLLVRERLLSELTEIGHLNVFDDMFKPLVDIMTVQTLNKQVTNDKVPLAICGENSSGKTTFIHTFLQIGRIMPTNAGPVSARIVKFSYASPAEACIRVYESLDKRSPIIHHHDLSIFFHLDSVNWSDIESCLKPHLVRPKSTTLTTEEFERSSEFAEWSQKFVEIRLPSPILKLGIDVYDTPGFLFHDAPVLKENVHNLVKLIRPTIVYMYQNPMTNDETTNGFLALKSALHGLDDTNIFLLNSHVDIDQFPDITDETNEDNFRPMLAAERRQRYEMLLKSPAVANDILGGLPLVLDECPSFDLCSALWNHDPLGRLMNDLCIKRIIQFTANNDLATANRVCHLVMPAVRAFSSLLLTIRNRTTAPSILQRDEALKWLDTFYSEHQKRFEEFLRKVFSTIHTCLRFNIDGLTRRALSARLKTPEQIENYLNSAIHHEVVKRSINEVFQSTYKLILLTPLSSMDRMRGKSNRLLCDALYSQEGGSPSADGTPSNICQTFTEKMFRNPTMLVLRVLDHGFREEDDDDTKDISESVRCLIAQRTAVRLREKNVSQGKDGTRFDPVVEIRLCLNEIEEQMNEKKDFLKDMIQAWVKHSKRKLQYHIDIQYTLAESVKPYCDRAFHLMNKYNLTFAKIECQLIAAQDLAKFNGIKPTIGKKHTQTENVFDVHDVEWGTKGNLMVKRLNELFITAENVHLSYLEGHYHRQLSTLATPGVLPLLYLHQNQLSTGINELWMFFPKYQLNLRDILQEDDCSIDLKQALQILIRIAETMVGYHLNGLSYSKLQPSNVFIDDNWKEIFLADLRSDILSVNDCHRAAGKVMNEDIRAFGQLGLQIVNVIQEKTNILIGLEILLRECIETSSNSRMNVNVLRSTLESIQNSI